MLQLIDRAVQRAAGYNFYLARMDYIHRLRRRDAQRSRAPVLIYQMGKVGSSSVSKSLSETVLDRRIYHVHFLTQPLIDVNEHKRRCLLGTRHEGDLRHIWQYRHLNERMSRNFGSERWKVITLVRDPVARNLATFFEHIEVVDESARAWTLLSPEYEFELNVSKDDVSPLVQLFFEKCRHDSPLEYFDREFKPVLEFDIYSSEFDLDKGYKIYQTDRFDVLLMRLENLNHCASEAICKFLDLGEFSLRRVNIGAEKDYADVYQLFKNVIHLPESYLDRLYASQLATHFYSAAELAEFRKRWAVRAHASPPEIAAAGRRMT